jgi:hypothetical protein
MHIEMVDNVGLGTFVTRNRRAAGELGRSFVSFKVGDRYPF